MYSTFQSLKKLTSIQNPTLFSQTVNTTAEEETKIQSCCGNMENKTGGGQGMEGRSCCSPKDRTQQLQAPINSGNCSTTQHQPYPFTASLHRCSDGQILLWISINKVKDRSRQPEEYLTRGNAISF